MYDTANTRASSRVRNVYWLTHEQDEPLNKICGTLSFVLCDPICPHTFFYMYVRIFSIDFSVLQLRMDPTQRPNQHIDQIIQTILDTTSETVDNLLNIYRYSGVGAYPKKETNAMCIPIIRRKKIYWKIINYWNCLFFSINNNLRHFKYFNWHFLTPSKKVST